MCVCVCVCVCVWVYTYVCVSIYIYVYKKRKKKREKRDRMHIYHDNAICLCCSLFLPLPSLSLSLSLYIYIYIIYIYIYIYRRGLQVFWFLEEMASEIWKRKFDGILLRLYNAVYKQNTKKKWTKVWILLFFRITKNYGSMTFTAISVKIYNALFLNCITTKVEKIFGKIGTNFGETGPQNLRFLLFVESRSKSKQSRGNTFICRFLLR